MFFFSKKGIFFATYYFNSIECSGIKSTTIAKEIYEEEEEKYRKTMGSPNEGTSIDGSEGASKNDTTDALPGSTTYVFSSY